MLNQTIRDILIYFLLFMSLSVTFRQLTHMRCKLLIHYKSGWYIVLLVSILLPFVLFFEQPFDLVERTPSNHTLYLLGFGPIFLVLFFLTYDLLPRYCTGYFHPAKWNFGREMLIISSFLVVLGTVYWLYEVLVVNIRELSFWSHVVVVVRTTSYGVLPAIVMKQTARVTDHWWHKITRKPEMLFLKHNEGDIPFLAILTVNAMKNYVCIKMDADDKCIEKTMHCSMKEMEKLLKPAEYFVKCHRSHIVNMGQVDFAKTKRLKNTLALRSYSIHVNVSKGYKAQVEKYMNDPQLFKGRL